MKFRPFEEAREFVHKLRLKNRREWYQYCKSGKKPKDIPTHPDRMYKNGSWSRWNDWLGIENQRIEFRPFKEAREFVHMLGLKNQAEWKRYCKSGQKPMDISTHPDRTQRNKGWPSKKGWYDWLGSKLNLNG